MAEKLVFIKVKNNISLSGGNPVYLSSHLKRHFGCFQILTIMNKNAYEHPCASFCVGICFQFLLVTTKMDSIVRVWVILWETPHCVPKWLYHFVASKQCLRISIAPYPYQHLVLSLSWIWATGHLIQRPDSLEKNPDTGKNWGQKEKGTAEDQIDSITHSVDLNKLREIMKGRRAWDAKVH